MRFFAVKSEEKQASAVIFKTGRFYQPGALAGAAIETAFRGMWGRVSWWIETVPGRRLPPGGPVMASPGPFGAA